MATRKKAPIDLSPITLNRELNEATILLVANWVRDTTLLYGGSISTAFTCAGLMARGLEAELRRRLADQEPTP